MSVFFAPPIIAIASDVPVEGAILGNGKSADFPVVKANGEDKAQNHLLDLKCATR